MDKVFTSIHPVKKFIYNNGLRGEHLNVYFLILYFQIKQLRGKMRPMESA